MKPIDLKTPISLVYSYKFADILADNAKKQRNIVIIIIVLNTLFKMFVTFIVVALSPEEDECVIKVGLYGFTAF